MKAKQRALPRSYSVEDAKLWAEREADSIKRGFDSFEMPPWMRSAHFHECWKAGCWLNAMLREHGATEKEVSDIGFCHGQRSAFGLKTWEWAVRYLNDFIACHGIEDEPGLKLADSMIKIIKISPP